MQTKMPSIILSDINMPGMSGLDLVLQASALCAETVVMMISGNESIDNAIGAFRGGAFDFIKKPFQLDGVEVAVKRAAVRHAQLVEKRRNDEKLEALVDHRGNQLDHLHNYDSHSTEIHEKAASRLTLRHELSHALEKGQLGVHYQPKIDTLTGQITGCEALMRWVHPKLGSISPNDFIPVAEGTGVIHEIGSWMLFEACTQARKWCDAGSNIQMAVNISCAQIEKGFAKTIRNILSRSGLAPELLNLEVTESSLMTNMDEAVATLVEIKSQGVRISIDDFGTGYSSLGYLKRLPVDDLKIDRSFIEDATSDRSNRSLVSAIIRLAHKLGLKVVAEGVETEDQLRFLKYLKCDEWQGYLASRPVPATDFGNLLGVVY
jgi:EAL domain-containing protein (putative c-di-GMP-specific phosphodiesterase class I)